MDALFEDLVWILWTVRPLWAGFCVGQSKIAKEFAEVIWVVFDTEFFVEKVLNRLH